MSADNTWHLAITDNWITAAPVIGQFDTAAEAAHTVSIVLHLVAAQLQTWASTAVPGDARAARAREIAARLLSDAAEVRAFDTERGFAQILDEPSFASIPLNTLSLHQDLWVQRDDQCDEPIPFSGRWSRRSLWLQTWTTRKTPRTKP
ncbi:hypothetical protein [Actinoplanes sp. NPDC051859]|uniref:hypothetical protein n=1 Tax=Actinoplanes sp. NPDC051859 TaxID=3363909 RepID=UPI003792E8A9